MIKILFAICFALVFSSSAFAITVNPKAEELKTQFLIALRSKDKITISRAWGEIDKDNAVKEYIKANHPRVYHAYEMRGIANRLHNLQDRYLKVARLPVSNQSVALDNVGQVKNGQGKSNSQMPSTNADIVRRQPNQVKISNRDIARSAANQDQLSNRDLLKSRLRK